MTRTARHAGMWGSGIVVALTAALSMLSAQTLLPAASEPTSRVEIFAGGNVKNVISQPSDQTSTTGSLGLRYIGRTYVATGVINVAGNSDTVTASFGATLLPPASGRALNAGLLDIRRRNLWGLGEGCEPADMRIRCRVGFHLYGTASSSRWASETDANGIVTATVDVPVWGAGVGLSYSFVDGQVGDIRVAMTYDLGLASRHLRGDLYSRDADRVALLGEDKRDFYGIETGIGITYNFIQAALVYYFMNGDVNGLSNGQVVAGVSIQANLNSGPVQDR